MSKKEFPKFSESERAELGSKVKLMRLDAGIKQAELADLADVSRATLYNIETGRTVPQEGVLSRIYDALGADLYPVEHSEQTTSALAVIGGMLDAVPERWHAEATRAAIQAIIRTIRRSTIEADPGKAASSPDATTE